MSRSHAAEFAERSIWSRASTAPGELSDASAGVELDVDAAASSASTRGSISTSPTGPCKLGAISTVTCDDHARHLLHRSPRPLSLELRLTTLSVCDLRSRCEEPPALDPATQGDRAYFDPRGSSGAASGHGEEILTARSGRAASRERELGRAADLAEHTRDAPDLSQARGHASAGPRADPHQPAANRPGISGRR